MLPAESSTVVAARSDSEDEAPKRKKETEPSSLPATRVRDGAFDGPAGEAKRARKEGLEKPRVTLRSSASSPARHE